MIFDKNRLCVDYKAGSGPRCAIEFTALDALQLVDAEQISVQVPIARAWREARASAEEQLDHPKPYDWTFTTLYTGTLLGEWTIEPYEPGLDLALLQRRDPILFYAETTLYEDELGDNGVAMLHLKLRAMNTGFFLLQRFFLRVDGGLVRVYDTRLQRRKGDNVHNVDAKKSAAPNHLGPQKPLLIPNLPRNLQQLETVLDKYACPSEALEHVTVAMVSFNRFTKNLLSDKKALSVDGKTKHYLIREVKRSQSSSWERAMTGVTLMAADAFCDQILEKRTEKLTPAVS
ncbi:TIP41-like family protein [Opisthorchis viverrini]|uniref:TIP41-like protein n=1 Tax=Opisthorchis viverrini TaxID=6198 RepID=A0A1S8WUU1_OPIVI|nr:TIP41-like family protein [Opisthorchis viverrini]